MTEAETLTVDGVEYRPCAKCRCPLAIVMGPNGKRIPLDLRAQVYVLGQDLAGGTMATPVPAAHVTHFATCTHASTFSKGGKR